MENKTNGLMFSVAVITYNQEKYIAQTLDSIINQNHDYSYEIVVGDDCSSDNTREIIRQYAEKYPEIVKPVFNEKNLGIIKNYFNVISHCSGKYIMECAGDDFWLPGKVELQIPFMERNPEVGMCYGKVQSYKNGKKSSELKGLKRENFDELLIGNVIPAATVCFKNELIRRYIEDIQPENRNWLMEDFPMWLHFAHESRIKFIDKVTSVYRVLENSASHSKDIKKQLVFEKSYWEIKNFFSEKYLNRMIPAFDEHLVLAYIYLRNSDRKAAKKEFLQSREQTFKVRAYELICSFEILFRLLMIKWRNL